MIGSEIAVDNSGGPSQGNFYVLNKGISVQGFAPSGTKLPGWPVGQKSEYGALSSIAVDPDGDVWLGHFGNPYLGMEVAPSGVPTGKTLPIVGSKYFSFCDYCQTLAFDSHKNAWYTVEDGSLIRSDFANDYDGTKVQLGPGPARRPRRRDRSLDRRRLLEPRQQDRRDQIHRTLQTGSVRSKPCRA